VSKLTNQDALLELNMVMNPTIKWGLAPAFFHKPKPTSKKKK
jgi:hypothetical protein